MPHCILMEVLSFQYLFIHKSYQFFYRNLFICILETKLMSWNQLFESSDLFSQFQMLNISYSPSIFFPIRVFKYLFTPWPPQLFTFLLSLFYPVIFFFFPRSIKTLYLPFSSSCFSSFYWVLNWVKSFFLQNCVCLF